MPEGPAVAAAGGADEAGRAEERGGVDAALACVGSKLDEAAGGTLGRVEAVLEDAADGTPTWLVIRLGRFGRRAAVPLDYVAPGVGRAWVPFDRDTVRAAADVDPGGGLSVAEERGLARRYGIPEGSGRPRTLAARGDDDAGSVPA